MMTIKCLPMNMLDENCYIIHDDTCEAIIIDCGALTTTDEQNLKDYVCRHNLKVTHHLCTHMHYDHCFGTAFLWNEYGVAPEFAIADEGLYRGEHDAIFGGLREHMRKAHLPAPARYLSDGDIVAFGHHSLKVLATPGHTPGGISFYCEEEKVVFVGDTLFYCSVGRTDFPGGSFDALYTSIHEKLFTLPEDTRICSGHGPQTDVAFEMQHNPYVR